MKILAIRGKNLASLEGEFEIDFTTEPLKSAGIFAITGITGSGKSTLLDALCLALFDDTPRTNRAGENIQVVDVRDRMINQRDSRTILRRGCAEGYAEVEFVSLGGERFRATWLVKRARGKADGSLQNSEIRLVNHSTSTEVQGRKTELLIKITELIGLTFDQFTRAVLLAQGDFATFLKAKQAEKAELLEKLTGTDIYSRISVGIYERCKGAEQEFNAIKERIKDVSLLSDQEVELLNAEKEQISKEITGLRNEVTALTNKIKWITDDELLYKEANQAGKMLELAEKAVQDAESRYEHMAQIELAQEIRDVFNDLQNAGKRLAANRKSLQERNTELEVNTRVLQQLEEAYLLGVQDQEELNRECEKREPELAKARELDVRMAGAKTNTDESHKEFEAAKQSADRMTKTINTTQQAIEKGVKTTVSLAAWFEQRAQYKEIVPRVELVVNLLNDAQSARKQRASNIKLLETCRNLLTSDLAKLEELKQESERLNRLLPAEIATLRAKLTDGVPCPVCGSLHHPFLGVVEGQNLQEEELNRAKKQTEELLLQRTERIEQQKHEMVRLTASIENYGQAFTETIRRAGEFLDALPGWKEDFKLGTLQNTLKEVAIEWGKNTTLQSSAQEQMQGLQVRLQAEQDNLKSCLETLAVQEKKLKNNQAILVQLQAERAGLLQGQPAEVVAQQLSEKKKKVAEKLQKLTEDKSILTTKQAGLAGGIRQMEQELVQLDGQVLRLQKEVQQWIHAQEGRIEPEQLSVLLARDRVWIGHEKEFLDGLKERVTTTKATLAERQKNRAQHQASEYKPRQEEETQAFLENKVQEKSASINEKVKRDTEIEVAFASHAKGIEQLRVFGKELNEKSVLCDNWKKLNEVFGSASGAKFKEMAQGYTLDALLGYANKHLQELSKRYQLQRIPDTLALQVVDLDMLGETRTVHSLSGGESFLISLALALGLSSLSSNRMKVESLFIDEGFGSLDIDTLRVAMDALERLQTQGRKIGVISHVAEMTERIPAQVQVVKCANGCSRIVVANHHNP